MDVFSTVRSFSCKNIRSLDSSQFIHLLNPGASGLILDGVKWWTSGACDPRCQLCIYLGRSSSDGPPHLRLSMILVAMNTPGLEVLRPLGVFGFDDAPHGHAGTNLGKLSLQDLLV